MDLESGAAPVVGAAQVVDMLYVRLTSPDIKARDCVLELLSAFARRPVENEPAKVALFEHLIRRLEESDEIVAAQFLRGLIAE